MLLEAILAEQPFYQNKSQQQLQQQPRRVEPEDPRAAAAAAAVDDKAVSKHQKLLHRSKESSERARSSPAKQETLSQQQQQQQQPQPAVSLSPSSKMMSKLDEDQNQMVKILIEQIATSNNFQQNIQPNPASNVSLKPNKSASNLDSNPATAAENNNINNTAAAAAAYGYPPNMPANFMNQQQQQAQSQSKQPKEVSELVQSNQPGPRFSPSGPFTAGQQPQPQPSQQPSQAQKQQQQQPSGPQQQQQQQQFMQSSLDQKNWQAAYSQYPLTFLPPPPQFSQGPSANASQTASSSSMSSQKQTNSQMQQQVSFPTLATPCKNRFDPFWQKINKIFWVCTA